MTIHFITRANKKRPPRYQVQRYLQKDKSRETLGSLPSDLNDTMLAEFASKLTPEEQLALDNFVGNMRFNKQHFNAMAGALPDREILYLPPELHQTIFKIWQIARKKGIHFNPHEIMLTALLEKTKALQKEISHNGD